MAGPTATVLLSGQLTPIQAGILGDVIHAVSDVVCGDDFWVTSTDAIGASKSFPGRPFICSVACDTHPISFGYSTGDQDEIEALLGIRPRCAITLAAMCNQPIDHEILARLARHIGAELNGIIDLNGEISLDAADHDGLCCISRECEYVTASHHYCTPEFLARYIEHEHFRMVK